MTDYTPSTDEVRELYAHEHPSSDDGREAFDRWYSAERAKWEKEVLEKAVERLHAEIELGHGLSPYGLRRMDAAVRGDGERNA